LTVLKSPLSENSVLRGKILHIICSYKDLIIAPVSVSRNIPDEDLEGALEDKVMMSWDWIQQRIFYPL